MATLRHTSNRLAAALSSGGVRPHTGQLNPASVVFAAMFAAMPVSFLFPARVLTILPSTLFAALLILLSLTNRKERPTTIGFTPVLVLTALIATVSCLANAHERLAIASYLGGYFSVLVVYLAVRLHRPTVNECNRAFVLFSITAMVSLVCGLRAFHAEVGIPNLSALMAARFMTEQIASYQAVTWGNVNNSATFLVQLMPLLIVPLMDSTRNRATRWWYLGCAMVCGLNMLIVGSRAAFLVFPVYLGAALYYFRSISNKTSLILILGMVLAAVVFLNGDDGKFWEYLSGATSIHNGDQSVIERIDSIFEGWDVMWEHAIVGVGPGCAMHHVSYDAAHQMSVNHGVEYGILGMFANLALIIQVFARFAPTLRARRTTPAARLEFTVLLSAFAFLLMGSIANAVISLGATNPWATTLAATLGIADCYRGNAQPKHGAQRARTPMTLSKRQLKAC